MHESTFWQLFGTLDEMARGVKRVDVDAALRLAGDGALIVDVLPKTVYLQEHLPGAVNLPLEHLKRSAVDGMDRARPVVVYCFDQH